MASFKEAVEKDLMDVFLELEFFGELHHIEGKEIAVIFDEEFLSKEKTEGKFGLEEATGLFFAKTSDLPKAMPVGNTIEIDGRDCTVMEWREDLGMTTVTYKQVRGR